MAEEPLTLLRMYVRNSKSFTGENGAEASKGKPSTSNAVPQSAFVSGFKDETIHLPSP